MDVAIVEAERLLHFRRAALERIFASGRPAAGGGEAERRELAEIDEALHRIASGTYGSCQACGGAIGRQRLRALPEVRFCVKCSS
ncbi:MAG TPA: TraR/DksA C4-type zinc finger protein [Anaeromyxobacteraceae bacterium]|jgi:hypothetical protein